MQVGQLHGVGERFDLRVQSAHVGVGDIGDFFEDELFGLLANQFLGQQVRAQVEQQCVTTAEFHVAQRVGQLHHSLFVGAPVDQHAALVEHLFYRDDFALAV